MLGGVGFTRRGWSLLGAALGLCPGRLELAPDRQRRRVGRGGLRRLQPDALARRHRSART